MTAQNTVILKVSLPKWFRVFYAIGAPLAVLLFVIVWLHYGRDAYTFSEAWKLLLFLAIVGLGLWTTPFFFSTILVTEAGLELKRLFGSTQRFSWDEIVQVSRPRFGIPHDAIYVFSHTGRKIVLSRGMTGYPELLKLIQLRAPNVSPEKLPRELRLSESSREWKYVLIFFGLFIMYVIARLIFKF
jgi:hypothetical protein